MNACLLNDPLKQIEAKTQINRRNRVTLILYLMLVIARGPRRTMINVYIHEFGHILIIH